MDEDYTHGQTCEEGNHVTTITTALPTERKLDSKGTAIPPPPVELMVVTPALVATIHLLFVMPKELPQLKPIQPHQSLGCFRHHQPKVEGLGFRV